MRREAVIDHFHVSDDHIKIDGRLRNWAAWCHGREGTGVSPMFRLYRPSEEDRDDQASAPVSFTPIDPLDATKVQKAMHKLPEAQRSSLKWSYITQGNPLRAARDHGVSIAGLGALVRSARQMLRNIL